MGILTGKYSSVDDVPAGSRAAGDDAKMMQRYFTQDVLDAVGEAKGVADEAASPASWRSRGACARSSCPR